MARDPSRRPTHPGEVLREDVLPELNLTQAQLAERLGVSRLTVSELLNERRALSPEMAVRLERFLGEPDAEMWLAMQRAVDLWEARRTIDQSAGVQLDAFQGAKFEVQVTREFDLGHEVHRVIKRAQKSSHDAVTAPPGEIRTTKGTT